MNNGLRWTNLWPGLNVLLAGGGMLSLSVAVAFGLLLSSIIATGFVWTGWVSSLAWNLQFVLLLIGSVVSYFWGSRFIASPDAYYDDQQHEALFRQASQSYLQGDWYEAEQILREMLSRVPQDLESRLMLATLYRHTRRLDFAEKELRNLLRFHASYLWEVEIAREWQQIRKLRSEEVATEDASAGEIPHEDTPVTEMSPNSGTEALDQAA